MRIKSAKMKTTRNRLVEFIRVKKVVSAADIAQGLKISPADARHHLASLEYEGVVRVVETRVKGRGRPLQMYGLSSELNRHNLDILSGAVLTEWLNNIPVVEHDDALNNLAARINDGYPPLEEGNLTQRLTHAVRLLNQMNYQSRWEAHLNAPQIILTHCPYASIVAGHPETCKMDTYLIGKVLGQSVTPISKLGMVLHGEVQCIFRLNTKQPLVK